MLFAHARTHFEIQMILIACVKRSPCRQNLIIAVRADMEDDTVLVTGLLADFDKLLEEGTAESDAGLIFRLVHAAIPR